MNDPLTQELRRCLSGLPVRAWRMHLDTPDVHAHTPMLRGVWGKALYETDLALYRTLFEGGPGGIPRYLIRPAPAHARPAPAVEFILFGPVDEATEDVCWIAWEKALRGGLGADREPARCVEVRPLAWDGTALEPGLRQPGFALAPLAWPGDIHSACRLVFPAPVRLLREGKLIATPSLADLTLATLRRVQAFLGETATDVWQSRHDWLERARQVATSPFQGGPLDLVRYSGRQQGEIELRGVAGELILPAGPGVLADVLLAARWLHVGKGTVMGMGEVRIERTSG